MHLVNNLQPETETALQANAEPIEWHQDCLAVSVLLASTHGEKAMRKLLKRHGYADAARSRLPESVLSALHEACHQDVKVRQSVARELNGRFKGAVAKTGGQDAQTVEALADERPWPVPIMWACFQHQCPEVRNLGRRLAHRALMEGMNRSRGFSRADQDKERADKTARRNNELRERLAEVKKDNERLRLRLHRRNSGPSISASAQDARIKQYEKEIKNLQRLLSEKDSQGRELRRQMGAWRAMAMEQGQKYEKQKRPFAAPCQRDSLEGGEKCLIDPQSAMCQRPADCPLNGRRVAVVGGLDRLEKDYCQTVEKLGGKCLCHTGKMRAGSQVLRNMVSKSDMVVCITPINSHGAMNVVKKHCKRCRKPFCPLNGTSAGALEGLLRKVAK